MKPFPRLGICLTVGLILAGNLFAQEDSSQAPAFKSPAMTPRPLLDDYYVKVGGSAVWFNPSKYQLPTARDSATSFVSLPFTYNPSDVAGQGGATVGFIISHAPAADWLGTNLRVEVSGSYLGDDHKITATDDAVGAGFYDVRSIAGDTLLGSIASPGNSVLATMFHAKYEMVNAEVLAKTDYSVDNGLLVFTPAAGFAFAYYDQKYSTQQQNVTIAANNTSLNESMENSYYGPKLGFEIKGFVTRSLVLFAGASTSLFDLESSYKGDQVVNSPGTTTAHLEESKNDFALRQQFEAGFYYDFKPLILRASGSGDYWQNVGTITRSSPSPGDAFDASSAPTSIRKDAMLNAGATVSLIYPF